jgi:hypothetical protein
VLPAIAIEAAEHQIGEGEFYARPAGQSLQPERDSPAAIEELQRKIGNRVFAAQYQQNPRPPEGMREQIIALAQQWQVDSLSSRTPPATWG